MCLSDGRLNEFGPKETKAVENATLRQRRIPRGTSEVSSVDMKSLSSETREEVLLPRLPLTSTILIFATLSFLIFQFSLWFPFVLSPQAANDTYVAASYHYEAEHNHFDNTAWTYGTDYFLSLAMGGLALKCLLATGGANPANSLSLRLCSAGLLTCYSVSVFAGGWAHQNHTTLDSLNTPSFRILWTVCVGTVTLAGGFMGACGSMLARGFATTKDKQYAQMPLLPEWGWAAFGIYLTVMCALGSLSFQRPACDIFIAGQTQFPPTAYCILVIFLRKWQDQGSSNERVSPAYRIMFFVGLLLNAPLLPLYPLMVQYTDWSLGCVNTILHTNLLCAWGMQALSLHHFCVALNGEKVSSDKKGPVSASD